MDIPVENNLSLSSQLSLFHLCKTSMATLQFLFYQSNSANGWLLFFKLYLGLVANRPQPSFPSFFQSEILKKNNPSKTLTMTIKVVPNRPYSYSNDPRIQKSLRQYTFAKKKKKLCLFYDTVLTVCLFIAENETFFGCLYILDQVSTFLLFSFWVMCMELAF